jgi:cytochrome c-type biogenesis protein CcmF
LIPIGCGLVVTVTLLALGMRVWTSLTCFAFSAFVCGTISQEFWRGARVRQGVSGTDLFTSLVGLVSRNRRRYGGYIIHVAIVLICLGFAGSGFQREEQVLLKPGQQVQVGDFVVRLDAVKVTDDGQKQMITGHTTVFRDGKELAKMYPARWFFRKHEQEPTTEVAIRRSIEGDLYLVMPAFDLQAQSASMSIVVNPLVNWVWIGFGVLAIGTGIALLPEAAYSFAVAKVPAGAVTAALVLLSLSLWPTALSAQTGRTVAVEQRSALERRLEGEILCTCGCRLPVGSCGMLNCTGHAGQTAKLKQFLAEGKDHDAVLAAFVEDFGSQAVLAAPIDKGFNRLAWMFPYLAAMLAAFGVFVTARRWSRPAAHAAAGVTGLDPELDARLDDELRNLD